jgi:hypothetical protein
MAIEEIDELQSEAPPAKRLRIEGALSPPTNNMDDMNDIHNAMADSQPHNTASVSGPETTVTNVTEGSKTMSNPIPGLGLLGTEPKPVGKNHQPRCS